MKTRNHRLLFFTFLILLPLTLATAATAPPLEVIDPNPVRGRFFVALYGNDEWSGKIPEPNAGRTDGPFKTFKQAQTAHRADNVATRIIVRQGTYYFSEPFVLGIADSGSTYEAYPRERVVISGGRRIKEWTKGPGNVWSARIPEVMTDKWIFRQLRVGDVLQPNARHPNVDPLDPLEGGWSFVVPSGQMKGAFKMGISKIQNPGDWIEWSVTVPRDGEYRVFFLYNAQNPRQLGPDVGPRMSLSVDGSPAVKLKNIRNTTRNVWRETAKVTMREGTHIVRWSNDEGGYLNLDALLFTNDPVWNPGRNRAPAAGRVAVTVQAEIVAKHGCKEIVIPEGKTPTYKNQFKFKFGDVLAYPKSLQPEYHMFAGNGDANTILYQQRADMRIHAVQVEKSSNAAQDIRPGNRFFVSNIMEGLDSPGEWYLDLKRTTLYYWPTALNFQEDGIVAPKLDRIIHIKGDASKNEFVQDITIKGMIFSDTTYSRHFNIFLPSDAAIWLSGARKCVLEGNRFVNLGGNAIRLEEQSSENQIIGNEIAHVGQGGVILLGDNETQPKKNVIAGNWIHHIGAVLKHVAGVYCVSASETHVAHNLFEDLPRYAISFKSLNARSYSHNNIAEYNDIYRTCLETVNGAAIETTGLHKLDTGNIIQYNRIIDTIGRVSAAGATGVGFRKPALSWGILLDAYSSGTRVRGNEVGGNAEGGLCVTGGRNNRIENNIFANGVKHQVLFRPDSFSQNNTFVRNVLQFSLPGGDFIGSGGRWSNRFFESCDKNYFWATLGVGQIQNATVPLTPLGNFEKWQAGGFDKHSFIKNPQLTGPVENDLRLPRDSPVYSDINFEALPYQKIGLKGFAKSWKKQ